MRLSPRQFAWLGLLLCLIFLCMTLGVRLWQHLSFGPQASHFDLYVYEGAKMEVRSGQLLFDDIGRGEKPSWGGGPSYSQVHPLPQYLMIAGLFFVGVAACLVILWH